MTATCSAAQPICPEFDDDRGAFRTPAGFVGWPQIVPGQIAAPAPKLLADVFDRLRSALLHSAIKDFVDAVSTVPEVEEVVLFRDEEGPHLWTALRSRDWDAETAVLTAHSRLRQAYAEDIDLFALVARSHELAETLPAGFIRLYARNRERGSAGAFTRPPRTNEAH